MYFYKIAKESGASQDAFEMCKLMELVDRIQPEKILEIGVHKGLSIKAWREAWPGAAIVGVDNDFSHLEFDDFLRVEGDSHLAETRDRFSTVGQFDFIFIDGDHTYGGVKKDFEMYSGLVRPGGIIALHDTKRIGARWKNHVEVARFFAEISKDYPTMEIWNGPNGDNGPGTGVVIL